MTRLIGGAGATMILRPATQCVAPIAAAGKALPR